MAAKVNPKLKHDFYSNVRESLWFRLSPVQGALYTRVSAHWNMGREVPQTEREIAEEYGVDVRIIKRAYAGLVELGLLAKEKKGRRTLYYPISKGGSVVDASDIALEARTKGDPQDHLLVKNRGSSGSPVKPDRGSSGSEIPDPQDHLFGNILYSPNKDLKKEEEGEEKGSITVGEPELGIPSLWNSNSGLGGDESLGADIEATLAQICATGPDLSPVPTTARGGVIPGRRIEPSEPDEVSSKRQWMKIMKILAGGDMKRIPKDVCAEWYRWFGHVDHQTAVSVAQVTVLQTKERWLPTRQEFHAALEAVQNPNPNLWSEEYEAFCGIAKLSRTARRTAEGWHRMSCEEVMGLLSKACPSAARWLRYADVKEFLVTTDAQIGFYRAQWRKRWEEGMRQVREAQVVERAVRREKVEVLG